ncbi:OmpW/AlkL family protein [Dyella sedimenti]|uniref:OmpW/AlkL family protein n=1 Tax=Dyella sedimenti TaxID=2919947 RepID=UPI001FAAFB92|nr:OmpW family outer membrane protein [Dyella sedimenti]
MIFPRYLCVASLLASCCPLAAAQDSPPDAYRWVVKVGVHNVDPKSNNGSLADSAFAVDVGNSVRPTGTIEYLLTPNLGIEALAAWPFKHDIRLNGTRAATAKELPPVISLQYHFLVEQKLSPYVGVGVNYTRFFNIGETGALAGTHLSLGSSWGVAAHAGVDYRINDRWLAGVDLRWVDLDTRVKLNGSRLGTVNVDPLVYGVYVGYRF